ncbi:MAG: hypothetical protein ACYDCN_06795 [Bacteroidia bacterium]
MSNTYPVELGTKHEIYRLSKRWFVSLLIFRWLFFGGLGVYLSYYVLYTQFLFNDKCNYVAVTYFAIISLACFATCGLPIDKFTNISLGK